MVSGKSTRWDCDVHLWRGIPDSFPSFHGWGDGSRPEKSSIPTRDARFFACHHCNTYVPDLDVPKHPCWDYPMTEEEKNIPENTPLNKPEPSDSDSIDDGDVCVWDDWCKEEEEEKTESIPKYVIATEENSVDGTCFLCKERLDLKYDQDEEEWIYPGCMNVDGKIAHEMCHSVVFDK